jgi:DnaJ family protein C protein 22
MTKSLKKAYLCWLFGGLFGLHHAYLRRDKQAFVWFSTLGGFFIGFINDFFRISEYVKEANEEQEFAKKLENFKSQLKSPAFAKTNFLFSVLIGAFFNYILKNCVVIELDDDEEDNHTYRIFILILRFITPLVISTFVYLIGTEGPIQCKFRWPLFGAILGFIVQLILLPNNFVCSLCSAFFLNWKVEWKHRQNETKQVKRKLYKRIAYFSIGSVLVLSIFGLYVWNNATLEVDGKQITLKESVKNFFNTQEMTELIEFLKTLWNFYQAHGWRKFVNNIYYGYDPEAIANAYNIIGLNEKASQNEVDMKCRNLSRKWHPDKFKVKKENKTKFF